MKKIYILLLLVFVSACSGFKDKGFFIDNNKLERVKEGITHKENVITNLGEPSFKIDDKKWLYYSYSINEYGLRKPRIANEKILILSFDEFDTVNKVFYKENKVSTFVANKKTTDLEKKKIGLFKELIEGLQYNVGDSL